MSNPAKGLHEGGELVTAEALSFPDQPGCCRFDPGIPKGESDQ
jgi:hypothetical protein